MTEFALCLEYPFDNQIAGYVFHLGDIVGPWLLWCIFSSCDSIACRPSILSFVSTSILSPMQKKRVCRVSRVSKDTKKNRHLSLNKPDLSVAVPRTARGLWSRKKPVREHLYLSWIPASISLLSARSLGAALCAFNDWLRAGKLHGRGCHWLLTVEWLSFRACALCSGYYLNAASSIAICRTIDLVIRWTMSPLWGIVL